MSMPPPSVSPATVADGAATAQLGAGFPAAVGASTTEPLTQSPPPPPAPTAASKLPFVIGAAVVVLAGGAVYALTQRSSNDPLATPPAPQVEPASVVPASDREEDKDPPQEEDKSIKRVRVVVLPGDVHVEIEGKAAEVKDSIVEIEGKLGSVHRVRVFKGTSETTADVVVTESGALPPKIEVTMGKKQHIARGDTKPSAEPAPPSVPTGIQEDPGEFDTP
jgi:serine/threonine-protein kinase